jgi:thermopsin
MTMESRRGAEVASITLLFLLLSPMLSAVSSAAPSPLPYHLFLSSGYYDPVQLDAPASPTTVYFAVSSDTALSIALMTSTQASSFANGDTGISDSLYYVNSSSVVHSMSVSKGIYYLMFYAYGESANVSFALTTVPVSPYTYYPLTSPEPSGVASFGLYNSSGAVTPYTVESSDVLGVADISSLQAYNGSAARYGDAVSGAALQLNSMLVVNEEGGRQQDYWVQDAPGFVTAASTVSWTDDVWNASVSGFLSNTTITSTDGGNVHTSSSGPSTGYYYSYQSSNTTYRLPLELALFMSETAVQGVGVRVQIGVQEIASGTAPAKPPYGAERVLLRRWQRDRAERRLL